MVAAGNCPDDVPGVRAALAVEIGVSEMFVAVRLARYGLMEGGV